MSVRWLEYLNILYWFDELYWQTANLKLFWISDCCVNKLGVALDDGLNCFGKDVLKTLLCTLADWHVGSITIFELWG
jgi:hypothetical protein